MAIETIKGISVKIGADTSDFIKQLKKVDKEINYSEKQAKELQKQLEIKFDPVIFREAQKKVLDDIEATEQKAKALKKQMDLVAKSAGVDSDSYKKLQVELSKTDTQALKLQQSLESINNTKTNRFVNQLKNMVTNLKASTVAIGAVAGAIYKIGTTASKAGGEIQDMADRLGVTAEQIQRYDYIALQSGVDTEQLVKSMAKARDAIGTALAGTTNTATTALQNLFGDLSRIPTSTEEGFNAIIEQLSKVEDSTMQAYYANEIFGEKLGTNLIPYINNGSEKINQLNAEFKELGYLTNAEVQELADFDDKVNNINKKIENLTYNLGVALVPILELVFSILEPFIPVLQAITDLITPIIDGIGWLADKINTLGLSTIGYGWLWGGDEAKNKLNNVFKSEPQSSYNENSYNYTTPTTNMNSTSTNYTDNSTTNIEINADLTGNLEYDTKTLADSVIREIVTKKQASGR